jgi:hypothetical protein
MLAGSGPYAFVACSSTSSPGAPDSASDSAAEALADAPVDTAEDIMEKTACLLERDSGNVTIFPESGMCPDGSQPLV